MKRSWLQHVVRGCGTLPHCGEHPGAAILIGLVLLGGLAGISRGGLLPGLLGALVMLLFFGSVYLVGAHNRSRWEDRINHDEPSE